MTAHFRRRLALLLSFLFSGGCISGFSQTVSMRRVVELALSHSSAAAIASADQERTNAALREAKSAYLPRVIFGSGIGGSYGFPLSLENAAPSLFNVTSQQVLYSPAQSAFVKAARSNLQVVNMQSKDQRDAVIHDAVLSYIELNKWEQDIDLLDKALANNQKMETVEQERIKAGVDKPIEQSRAKLASARVRVRLAEAKGSADVLRAHLGQLTGLSATELETDTDSIPTLPEVKQDEDLGARAVAANPVVKAAQQQVIAKELMAQGEHRALYPSLDVAGQYALLSNFNNYQVYIQQFQHHNATGGLVVRLPFFDSTQRARAAEAKADYIRSTHEAEVAKQKVSLETLRLQRGVQELSASVEVAQLEYDLAQSDLESIQIQIKSGNGTLRDEQDARGKVEQSYDALVDANFALDKARIQLLRNTGELEQWARSGR